MSAMTPLCGTLARRCRRETGRLLVIYVLGYLGLFSLAVAGRLVRDGAPLFDVLRILPEQLAFPATIALPLALVTALLNCLGRMREDGELIALQASGISPVRLGLALLPLVCLAACAVGVLAHWAMPAAYNNLRDSMSAVVRQAIGTQVSRRRPIFADRKRGISITADGADGNTLDGVFIHFSQTTHEHLVCFAPSARWVSGDDASDDLSLRLELQSARLMRYRRDSGTITDFDLGVFERMVIDLSQEAPDNALKPDAMPTMDIADGIDLMSAALSLTQNTDDHRVLIHDLLALPDAPLHSEDIRRPQTILAHLQRPPLARLLAPDTIMPDPDDPDIREQIAVILDNLLPRVDTVLHDGIASMPWALRQAHHALDADTPPPTIRRRINRRLLADHLDGALRDELILDLLRHIGRDQERNINRSQRELRGLQMAWHLRWLLSVGVFAYAALACGLAFTIPTHNRMVAIFLGLMTVLISILPGFTAVKGLRGHLSFNPAWIMWTPTIVLALIGTWLLWRRR